MEARTPFASGNAASVLYVTLRLDYFREPERLLRLIKPDLVGAGCAAMLVLPFAVPYTPALLTTYDDSVAGLEPPLRKAAEFSSVRTEGGKISRTENSHCKMLVRK
jgi:hypothetical protein